MLTGSVSALKLLPSTIFSQPVQKMPKFNDKNAVFRQKTLGLFLTELLSTTPRKNFRCLWCTLTYKRKLFAWKMYFDMPIVSIILFWQILPSFSSLGWITSHWEPYLTCLLNGVCQPKTSRFGSSDQTVWKCPILDKTRNFKTCNWLNCLRINLFYLKTTQNGEIILK